MIDIGVNLLHPQFDEDRERVLERARGAGISDLLITCTDMTMLSEAIRFAESHDLHCTAGVHPHEASAAPDDLDAVLRDALSSPRASSRVRAIGETGLDFNRNYSAPAQQRAVFRTQLEVAVGCGLPVFVHDRDSSGEVAATLEPYMDRLNGVVVHCFTGDAHDLDSLLGMGCHIGITGWICDERRGSAVRALLQRIPLNRLLIETDAPFLKPRTAPRNWHLEQQPPVNKRRNEPALLGLISGQIAEATGQAEEVIRSATASNARRLFGLVESAERLKNH